MRLLGPTLCALSLLGATFIGLGAAQATEQQWRLGADLGYGRAVLSDGTLSGLGGGLHATYGLTDEFNLRVAGDVSWFDRPAPATYALLWSSTVGVEYVLDVLDWIPYAGISVGAMGEFKQGERHDVFAGFEIPAGLGYQVLPELTVGAEFRYRMMVLGTDAGVSMMAVLGRVEYVWGD